MSVIKVNTIQNANGTTGITFAANGQMTLANTPLQLTGGQIKFPSTKIASADGNTLDDYEEGTWTPVIGGFGGESGQSYSGQAGYYTKIGRMVYAQCRVALSNKGTITGDVTLKGLPFTAAATISYNSGGTYYYGLAVNWVQVFLQVTGNSTQCEVRGAKAAVSESTALTTSDIGNSTQFNASFTYYV